MNDQKKVTIDTILDWFTDSVEKAIPISPTLWLDGATKLNALLGNMDDSLIEAEMSYRRLRSGFIEDGKTAAEAETRSKASDAYRDYLKLKAKRDRCSEFIMLAKKRAGVQSWEKDM